jgi:hypothetical protein
MGEPRYVDRMRRIGFSKVGAIEFCPYSRTRVNLHRDPKIGRKPHQWTECVIGDSKSRGRNFADTNEAEIAHSTSDN